MATTSPWTLQLLQDQTHTLLEGDSDTPETTDDDWSARLNMMNAAIMSWESERETSWNELWVSDYTVGTVAAGTQAYAIASNANFKEPGGFVRLELNGATKELPVVKPEDAQLQYETAMVAYYTGNPQDGYTLNLRFTPATGDGTVGATIKIDYYKYADRLAATTDVPEMSDPMYIVYKVVAQVALQRSNNNMYSVYEAMASNALLQMKMANLGTPHHQNSEIVDVGEGFGV